MCKGQAVYSMKAVTKKNILLMLPSGVDELVKNKHESYLPSRELNIESKHNEKLNMLHTMRKVGMRDERRQRTRNGSGPNAMVTYILFELDEAVSKVACPW